MDDRLHLAIALLKNGDKSQGKKLLEEILRSDSQNELAWLWLTTCATTNEERIRYLKKVLEINPRNETAIISLRKLQYEEPPIEAITSGAIKNEHIEDEIPKVNKDKQKKINIFENDKIFRTSIVVVVVLALFVVTLFIYGLINLQSTNQSNSIQSTQDYSSSLRLTKVASKTNPTSSPIPTSSPNPTATTPALYPGPARKYIPPLSNAMPLNFSASDITEFRKDGDGSYYNLSYLPNTNGSVILDNPSLFFWGYVGESIENAQKRFNERIEDVSTDTSDTKYSLITNTYVTNNFDGTSQYYGICKNRSKAHRQTGVRRTP